MTGISSLQMYHCMMCLWNSSWQGVTWCDCRPPVNTRADARFASSQWERALQSNAVSHWLGANLESALNTHQQGIQWQRAQCDCTLRATGYHAGQGWGQIRICICKYKYKYKYGVFVFVFVFDQISSHVFVFVFVFDPPYLVYLTNTFSNTLFSWAVF